MNDLRLIEDYLPIEAISAEASSEPRTKGHISTLHIWRARRPLVACRAAVYGALVPATQFTPEGANNGNKESLGRANAAKFMDQLCRYPGDYKTVAKAQKHILEAHAARLSRETGNPATLADIESGRAPRPKVLDMFAGGGAIPLEAARLGCESHAVELNPVAHLIELGTVTFPQQFGPELADDVEQWARRILAATRVTVKDVMPILTFDKGQVETQPHLLRTADDETDTLSIVAHYWTRTVPCPNPQCKGKVPLYRQTWLRKKESGYVALRPVPDYTTKVVRFEVVRSPTIKGLGFEPSNGSEGSATVCPFCNTTVEGPYVRNYGDTIGFGQQLMCIIALNPEGTGKLYIADESLAAGEAQLQSLAELRAAEIERELSNSSLDETIPPTGNAGLATGNSYLYGIKTFRHAFTPRQRLVLLAMSREIRRAHQAMLESGMKEDRAKAVTTYHGLWLSRLTDRFNSLSRWDNSGEKAQGLTSMKRFAMAWDFPEINIFGGASGDALGNLEYVTAVIRQEGQFRRPAVCIRGSATELPFADASFDAVVTDPPYYDNESYSELSDVCYVWLRPAVGFLYPEHFAGQLTPKKKECVAAAYRQGGRDAARLFYEETLFKSLQQAYRVSKPGGILVLVYAHKTTLGWSTLVEAIRRAGYEVTEAWPLDTETKSRIAHRGDAALATSIFLVGVKRERRLKGDFDNEVRPLLEEIVSERVETLWDMGISGADLVIACVGAGLRAFTRFVRVEFSNGEQVPAERFLLEVETVVLETILARLSREAGAKGTTTSLAGLDPNTRCYILWRYTYHDAELDAGEAIVFANGTHVELDGHNGLSAGARALIEKKKGKYRLLDFAERGEDAHLGMPSGDAQPAPLIDALHRTLWLMENRPGQLGEFLREAQPNREQMRLVAQALAGPALTGGELEDVSPTGEMAALRKLTSNWRSVIEDNVFSSSQRADRKSGQQRLFE